MSRIETETRKSEQDIRTLRHDEVDAVSGGTMHGGEVVNSEFVIVKLIDASTPKF